MKLGRIAVPTPDGEQIRLVAAQPEQGRVIDLARAYALTLQRKAAEPDRARALALAMLPGSLAAGIGGGGIFLDAAHEALAAAMTLRYAIDEVSWRAAVDSPVIRDGLTFEQHIQNFHRIVAKAQPARSIYERPGYFKGTTAMSYGHDQELPYPDFTEALDWELEIGYVVGKSGSDLTPDDGAGPPLRHHHLQRLQRTRCPGRGDGHRHGPAEVQGLRLRHRPVGHHDRRNRLHRGVERPGPRQRRGALRHQGRGLRLHAPPNCWPTSPSPTGCSPGDLIGSGTMGFGAGVEIGRFLKPGDVIELELEGVGTLRTPISTERQEGPLVARAPPYPPTRMRMAPMTRTPSPPHRHRARRPRPRHHPQRRAGAQPLVLGRRSRDSVPPCLADRSGPHSTTSPTPTRPRPTPRSPASRPRRDDPAHRRLPAGLRLSG